MDAVCEKCKWDVWLFEQGGEIVAAMPHYIERREDGLRITKAPLTQNNGIIFSHPSGASSVARAKFEEKVIFAADEYISNLGLCVYEQQYQTSFTNWLPFSWRGYSALPRYTYVISNTSNLEEVWSNVTAKQRSCIKKGQRNAAMIDSIDAFTFYDYHAKVFARQGLPCPFSKSFWLNLESECRKRGQCITLCAKDASGKVASVIFLVCDDRRMYHILGGSVPGFQGLDTYSALIWHAIELASKRGLVYDFEGSMIERISRSFREYGGEPQLYFRIRKVFDACVMRAETEEAIRKL